jgi:hypothetical protein
MTRCVQLVRSTSNPAHPFSNFGTGNAQVGKPCDSALLRVSGLRLERSLRGCSTQRSWRLLALWPYRSVRAHAAEAERVTVGRR